MYKKEEELIDLEALLSGDITEEPTVAPNNTIDKVLDGVETPSPDPEESPSEITNENKEEEPGEEAAPAEVETIPPVSDNGIDPKEEPTLSTTSETNKALILDLIEKGTIPAIENIDEVDFDADFSDLLNQMVTEITKSKFEDLKDKESKKTPEILKQALELSKNGGDYLSILEEYKDVVNPMENLNLENEQDQMKALFNYYVTFHPGISDEEIIDFIQIKKTKGQLEEASRQASTKVTDYFQKKVQDKLKESQDLEATRKESIKTQKSSIRKILKDQYNLSETLIKKYVDFGYKEGEDGRFQMDKTFEDITLNNPEVTAKLIILLQDPEGLDKIIESRVDSSVMEKQIKGFRFAKQNKKSNATIDPLKESQNKNKLEDLSDLFPQ